MNTRSKALWGSLTILLSALLAFAVGAHLDARELRVAVLDVGQGDAILIRTPQEQNILIDGGPGSAVLERLAEQLPFYDRTVDLLILTHPHADHVNGLVDVLRRYTVRRVLYTGALHTSQKYLDFLALIRDRGIPLEIVDAPRDIMLGGGIDLRLLYPLRSFRDESVQELNDTSIVAKLSYGDSSFLFTGDAEAVVERELLERDTAVLNADVLKVGHHGSDSSSTGAFLDAVSPDYAAISVGAGNRYGHPHASTLDKLRRRGVRIFRTDEDGTIVFVTDGKEITPHLDR